MKRILVCEDEDAIRDFVVINLKRSGYDVIDVSNAAQAMDAYVHYGGLIDVAPVSYTHLHIRTRQDTLQQAVFLPLSHLSARGIPLNARC